MFSPEGLACFCSGNAETGYRLIYNIELYLRLVVRWELIAAKGDQWKSNLGALQGEARSRQTTEAEIRLIDTDPHNLLDYLTLTELKDLMLSDALWPFIKDRWPPRELLVSELKLFNNLRHKAAHFRSLTDRDLRRLDHFKSIVSDMTAYYRRVKRGAKELGVEAVAALPEHFAAPLTQWVEDSASPDGRWRNLTVRIIGKYLVADAQLRAGSFAPDAVTDLVNGTGCDAFFLSLDTARGQMRAYFPQSLSEKAAKKLLPRLFSLPCPDDRLLDDDLDGAEERLNFVMPYEVELPMEFRQ